MKELFPDPDVPMTAWGIQIKSSTVLRGGTISNVLRDPRPYWRLPMVAAVYGRESVCRRLAASPRIARQVSPAL